jgi:Transposase
MNLKQSPNPKTGRTYLSIVKGYREAGTGKAKAKTVLALGYLDDLQQDYPDPIAHFKEVARQMTEEENAHRQLSLNINMDEDLSLNQNLSQNIGYAAIMQIYNALDLPLFLRKCARGRGFKYDTNAIMALLVISRLLSPGSKKKAYEERNRYFERFNFSLADVYRALSHYAHISQDVQRHINERIASTYGRDSRVIYYDVTNYYFEIDAEDELRKYGLSKEKRRDPIVQMGLAMDAEGIPLHYELFSGNIPDKSTFRSVIGEIRRHYDTGRIIVVADMGIITGDNIYYLVGGEKREKSLNGYIFSFSVRGGTQDFQAYVLDENEYRDALGNPVTADTDFKLKSRIIAREVTVTLSNGRKAKRTVYEKQIVFWSRKYAERARRERGKVVTKALSLVSEPHKYSSATSRGAAKYVKSMKVDTSTGEMTHSDRVPVFDAEKVCAEELLDGYYSIVTSETDMPEQEVIETYRGLWEIEETFRITKGTLETRPVYVSREDRIEAHFLTCYIALVIARLLQKQVGKHVSVDKILECLRNLTCTLEADNIYLFGYRSDLSDEIGNALDIDFKKKRLRLADIKSMISKSKNRLRA